jgi:hypothetical protein
VTHDIVAHSSRGISDLARSWLAAILLGATGLILVVGPSVVDGRIPGDLGDARFNSYLLEHFLRWITREDVSFWSADFYFPYPLTVAFSDNYLGNAFVYTAFRSIGLAREDAFRWWYVAGFAINFAAADYALVQLGYSRLAAALGAFLFAFGLPITAQENHVQLVYRFGVPLAVLALVQFGTRRELRYIVRCAFWTTWQFYCSIYTGYFLVLLLLAFALGHALSNAGRPIAGIRLLAFEARKLWTRSTVPAKAGCVLATTAMVALIALLGTPYHEVGRLYGFHRSWFEIALMLPRPQSYILTSVSRLWPSHGPIFDALPMRHEHAMFIGLVPFVTIASAATLRSTNRTSWDRYFVPTALAVALLVLLTLWVHGYSAYRILAWLPGVDAIRAVTRIIAILLFPCAMLFTASLDAIAVARLPTWMRSGALTLIAALLVLETSYITHYYTTVHDWQGRMAALATGLPPTLPKDPILLLSPKPDEAIPRLSELDAMLFAQDRGWRTLNGYSGNTPPEHELSGQCEDAAHNLASALAFLGRGTGQAYEELIRHVVMVGYPPCDDAALPRDPRVTIFAGAVPAALMANVALQIERVSVRDGQVVISSSVVNHSPVALPAASSTATPIRLSARFIDTLAAPPDPRHGPGWDARQAIFFDIPAGSQEQVAIHVAPPRQPGRYRVEISMVQERIAWFHDHGLHVPVSKQIVEVDDQHIARIADAGY